ncbi:hypothetical protein LL024_06970 [Enterobacter ludwigii]|uniref:hypothetical protein n=1 Tax=Enterobacter ludwigii TaxID=299767 RepID=UPI001D170F5F|nr:hypothetical protein [Enterobacter ludwigii]UEG34523.1 hypothetical protein LL022_06985 [Enterobacter ludwigii]UEG36568.1 hypothetical protein LL023_16755 [Enterobacter ludwigii]UEG43209.1 hypothetical protein LL024_06970 [Enterobacter ludwigii]
MDKVNTVSILLISLSLALIAIFLGIGSVSGSIPIGNSGVSLQATKTFPFILIIFWLFVWQRFTVLSLHENRPTIDKLILDKINISDLVHSVFSAKKFGFPGAYTVCKWGWNDPSIPKGAPGNYIHYKRGLLARRFKLSFLGNDSSGAAKYVHFGPKASNIENGKFTPINLGYWKCLFFEAKFLMTRLFDTPLVGQHYLPHSFAWIAVLVLSLKPLRHLLAQIFQ